MDDSTAELDEDMPAMDSASSNPEAVLLSAARRDLVQRALEDLPAALREIVILREMEGMSYKEIAEVTAVPIGTVMSRLARARARLQQLLAGANSAEVRA